MANLSGFSNNGRTREDDQRFYEANNALSRTMGRPELFPGAIGLTDSAVSNRENEGGI